MRSSSNSPLVRVYLFTYRRKTLSRALDSLLQQTFTNWVCEIHNDDPDDDFPKQLVDQCKDARLQYVCHQQNLGPLRSFNLAFSPTVSEEYVSILEDDNWWEPEFLKTVTELLKSRPEVNVAWANMWLWAESRIQQWERVGCIWPEFPPNKVVEFVQADPRQVCGMLHSHGAMLVRVSAATMFQVPEELPVFAIEAVRERAYPGALLLLTSPLANFAITRGSARSETADENMQIVTLLARTFLQHARLNRDFYRQVWNVCRGSLGHKHRALIVAAFQSGKLRSVVRQARLSDLLLVTAWAVRHPCRFQSLFRARRRFPNVYEFLDRVSSERLREIPEPN